MSLSNLHFSRIFIHLSHSFSDPKNNGKCFNFSRTELNIAFWTQLTERNARFVEDVDSARDRKSIPQEELNNKLYEQMNRAICILSIVAAIFLPLGPLNGLLGINVGPIQVPKTNWHLHWWWPSGPLLLGFLFGLRK